jgi:hypothetical protein
MLGLLMQNWASLLHFYSLLGISFHGDSTHSLSIMTQNNFTEEPTMWVSNNVLALKFNIKRVYHINNGALNPLSYLSKL